MKCLVIAEDRNMLIEEKYTIREVKEIVKSRGSKLSLRSTLRHYGLTYISDRPFISRYRNEFELSDSKGIDDITLKELKMYKDILVLGNRVQR